ncbi:MAG TPA: hypothetical protein VKU80_09475 [Planctomycetota bacterium]|nr:hypothetical protein [Planctomycetota bacterium]
MAVAALALTCQVASTSHSQILHDDAPSKCQDPSKHFCAEAASEDAGRCFVCQVSVGNLTVSSATISEPFWFVESAPQVEASTPSSLFKFSPAAPRAPPSLPA